MNLFLLRCHSPVPALHSLATLTFTENRFAFFWRSLAEEVTRSPSPFIYKSYAKFLCSHLDAQMLMQPSFFKMGQSRPLFVYFRHFLDTISIIQIEKSIVGVLGTRTRGRRMVGADETTELWLPPMQYSILQMMSQGTQIGRFPTPSVFVYIRNEQPREQPILY